VLNEIINQSINQDAPHSISSGVDTNNHTIKMGKEMPTEGRAPITADISKVRNGGVTKAQPTTKENKTLSSEDEVRLSGLLAGSSDRPAEEVSKPEVIDLDSGSNDDEQEDSEVAEDDYDENEDEDELWVDDDWGDEWEDEGDDVTKVQLPQPKNPTSSLTTREAFIITTVHETRDPIDDKYHEVHGVYSHVLDANRAAQKYAQEQVFSQNDDRYKERIYIDGTFHARAKGGRDERVSVDVEVQQYTVRQEVAP